MLREVLLRSSKLVISVIVVKGQKRTCDVEPRISVLNNADNNNRMSALQEWSIRCHDARVATGVCLYQLAGRYLLYTQLLTCVIVQRNILLHLPDDGP